MEPEYLSRMMEKFGRSKNIPLADTLNQTEMMAIEGLRVRAKDGEEAQKLFLWRMFVMYTMGFPEPLPVGTKAITNEDSE